MAQHLTLDSPWQVPITFVDRVFGESKLGPGEIVGCVWATRAHQSLCLLPSHRLPCVRSQVPARHVHAVHRFVGGRLRW